MSKLINSLKMTLKSRKGQGTVEYALVTLAVVLILAAVLFATDNPLKQSITDAYQRAADEIDAAKP